MDARSIVIAGLGSVLLGATAPPAAAQDLRAIQRQLQAMQKLIEQQQRTIQELERQVQAVQSQQTTTQEQAQAAEAKAAQAVAAVKDAPVVSNANRNAKLTLSGHINRMVNVAGDGDKTKAYFVDNNLSVSRLAARADAQITDDVTGRAVIELGLAPNRSDRVSQTEETLSSDNGFDLRKIEGVFASKTFGTLYFGRGDPSTKDIAKIDLSGTDVLAYTAVQDVAGGLFFFNGDTDSLSGTRIRNVFTDLDPSRQNRARYDTPSFAGFTASLTGAEDQKWNSSLKWSGQTDAIQAAAGIGLSDPSINNDSSIDNGRGGSVTYDLAGSGSILHRPTGLNLTAAAGNRHQDGSDPNFVYVKGGWRGNVTAVGTTALSLDWQRTDNNQTSSDQADSVGLAVVQNVDPFGLQLYAGYRFYRLDRSNADFDDVHVVTTGTRIRF